jgi:hypothetical protein
LLFNLAQAQLPIPEYQKGKAIYVKTLAELIETWFPQKAMLRKLGDLLTEETWKNTCHSSR